MSQYLVELWLDGYDNQEEREAAELKFIEEQLDMTASMVKVIRIKDKISDENTHDKPF